MVSIWNWTEYIVEWNYSLFYFLNINRGNSVNVASRMESTGKLNSKMSTSSNSNRTNSTFSNNQQGEAVAFRSQLRLTEF